MATPVARKKIFISYSHADEEWFEQIKVHLTPLQSRLGFEIWHDKLIQPGQDWHAQIQKALSETKVAVLLVSPKFLASDYINNHELKPLVDAQARENGLIVTPLHVRSANVEDFPELTTPQALNNPSTTLAALQGKQDELDKALAGISRKIKELMQSPTAAPANAAPPPLRARSADAESAGADQEENFEGTDADEDLEYLELNEVIAQSLQWMFDEPGEQALDLLADDGEEQTLLLRLVEGGEDNLICEIATNEELHPDLRLDRKTARHLIHEYGFCEPEIPGDRLWKDLGPIEDLDAQALGDDLATLLDEAFGLPSEDLDVVSDIYAV